MHITLSELISLRLFARQLALRQPQKALRLQTGLSASTIKGRGMDFDETRLYQPGDDVRFMDWRVMARTGKAHTKLFCEEKDRPVLIIIDQSLSLRFGTRLTFKSILAAQLAAILAWMAYYRGERVGGIVFHDQYINCFKPQAREQSVLSLLRQVEKTNHETPQKSTATQLATVIEHLNYLAQPDTLVYLISDFSALNTDISMQIKRLLAKTSVHACFISDPFEQALPPRGHYPLTDLQETVILNAGNKALSQAYHASFTTHENQLKALFSTPKSHYAAFSTAVDIRTASRQYDSRRGY